MTNTMLTIVVIAAAITLCSGSAIPMWEFLSRGEKMSHLYSMFAKQVSSHCKSNVDMPVAECKRELLVYGVDKLEKMSDSHLDSMDPYQRGANDIIWDSMMDGHRTKPSKKHESAPTQIRVNIGQYEPNPLFAGDLSNGAANVDKTHKASSASSSSSSSAYAMGMDNIYSTYNYPTAIESLDSGRQPQNHLVQEPAAATSLHLNFDRPASQSIANNFLSGPMVFRVRPDGTPVEEDKRKPLPRDDDREAMTIGKDKIPTAQQINNNFSGPLAMPPHTRRTTVFSNYRTTDRRFRNY